MYLFLQFTAQAMNIMYYCTVLNSNSLPCYTDVAGQDISLRTVHLEMCCIFLRLLLFIAFDFSIIVIKP